ncbi:hypothetical protein Aple_034320 [Acrocarpospora pleiomorpha]|uniref:Uncharacterized protein n=1 Tax=Acrocarpospora pleiomorpha TaxID=90975 RepID=A0A5M3XII1_9ACTN|nr:hypothetical protein [Acrocarpospora pleiomorpha]GES20536.1 hypothetical protein Aple_034320 [Acrocarpospora pleiomorpha]
MAKMPTPSAVAATIGRVKRYTPDADTTELYRELGISHVAKKAREIVAKFPRPTEDQIQAVAEILRGADR